MKSQTTILPRSEIEISVEIPFSEFEPHVKRAASLIAEEVDIEGFRRGKAPYDIVKKSVGESAIYERAADLAVRKTYTNLIETLLTVPPEGIKEFTPIGNPDITVTKLAPGNELTYKIKIALMPQVTLPDYREIASRTQKEKKEIQVSEEEIQKTLEWICESRLTLHDVERPLQLGDAVEIDFDIRHGGVKWEGGESKNHPLIIGKNKFLPGFEDHLIGMRKDESKKFSLAAPADWHDKNLADKMLDIEVQIKSIKERRIPEMNDDFVKQLGKFASVQELTDVIRDNIRQEKQEKEQQRVRALTIETIAAEMKADIPDVLVDREMAKMLDELKNGIENMGMKWEDYLLHLKKTTDDLMADMRQDGIKRVRIALTLHEIAKAESINPADEEVETRTAEILKKFQTPDEAKKEIDPERLREYAKGILKNEKVFEFLEIVK